MKKFLSLVVLGFALVTPTFAQTVTMPVKRQISFDELIRVRELLIKKYVLTTHQAWGVSVCGDDDIFGSESSWLTIYVYSDSVAAVRDALADGQTGLLKFQGVPIVLDVIKRPKK